MRYLVLTSALLLSLPVAAAETTKVPANNLVQAGALAQVQAEAEIASKAIDFADVVGFIIQKPAKGPNAQPEQSKIVVSRTDKSWPEVVKLVKQVADERVAAAKEALGKLGLEATPPTNPTPSTPPAVIQTPVPPKD